LKVILTEIAGPITSVRHIDTYQVATSYPLIPPSTLIGAIGYALGRMSKCRAGYDFRQSECFKVVRTLVSKARMCSSSASKASVMLKRVRGVLEEGVMPKTVDEFTKFSDALIREYIVFEKMKALIIPTKQDKDVIDAIAKAMWLIERLGDSESLVAVTKVSIVDAKPCNEDMVDVVVKANVVEGGNLILMRGSDEDYNITSLAYPVTSRAGYFMPSSIKVRSNIKVYCADGVRFPVGGDW